MTELRDFLVSVVVNYFYECNIDTVYSDLVTYNVYGFRDFVKGCVVDNEYRPVDVIDKWSDHFNDRVWAEIGAELLYKQVRSFHELLSKEVAGQYFLIHSPRQQKRQLYKAVK